MATMTLQSQASVRLAQPRSGPLSHRQLLLIVATIISVVVACVAAMFLLPSSRSALLNHRDINATGQSATALLKASPAELSRSLATWKDQWVDWEVGVAHVDPQIVTLKEVRSPLHLFWEGAENGVSLPRLPSKHLLLKHEMQQVQEWQTWQALTLQGNWQQGKEPPMLHINSMRIKARITVASLGRGAMKNYVVVCLTDWKRLP